MRNIKRTAKVGVALVLSLALAIVLYCAISAMATPITSSYLTARMGAYTGPEGGTEQDDNVKASLDLAHTDLDSLIQLDADMLGLLGIGTGNVFYVDSGTDGTAGTSWATAVGTLDEAIALCTTNAGDIILIAAGHSEALSAADGVDVDKSDIVIIGLGSGENRPLFDYTNANGEFVFGADDAAVINCRFHANVTAVTHAIDVEAGVENITVRDCVFDVETAGTDEFTDAITIAGTGSDGVKVVGCLFDMGGTTNADPDSGVHFIDCDNLVVSGCTFFGDYGDACIQNETTASNFVTIENNKFFNGIIGGNAGLNTQPVVELVATTTGVIINNQCFCNVASSDLAIVAADCFLSNNTYYEQEGGYALGFSNIGQRHITATTTGAMGGGDYQAADDPTIFTVTGDILCRACATISTQITSTSNDTLELGVPGNTAALLVQDVADGTAFDAGDTWSLITAADADGAQMADEWLVVSDGDIVLTIDDHDITAGVATFYLEWIALSDDAQVVGAAP